MFKHNNTAMTKWLIQWVGSSAEDTTWEPATDIISRYPSFQHDASSSTVAVLKGDGDVETKNIGPSR